MLSVVKTQFKRSNNFRAISIDPTRFCKHFSHVQTDVNFMMEALIRNIQCHRYSFYALILMGLDTYTHFPEIFVNMLTYETRPIPGLNNSSVQNFLNFQHITFSNFIPQLRLDFFNVKLRLITYSLLLW